MTRQEQREESIKKAIDVFGKDVVEKLFKEPPKRKDYFFNEKSNFKYTPCKNWKGEIIK